MEAAEEEARAQIYEMIRLHPSWRVHPFLDAAERMQLCAPHRSVPVALSGDDRCSSAGLALRVCVRGLSRYTPFSYVLDLLGGVQR